MYTKNTSAKGLFVYSVPDQKGKKKKASPNIPSVWFLFRRFLLRSSFLSSVFHVFSSLCCLFLLSAFRGLFILRPTVSPPARGLACNNLSPPFHHVIKLQAGFWLAALAYAVMLPLGGIHNDIKARLLKIYIKEVIWKTDSEFFPARGQRAASSQHEHGGSEPRLLARVQPAGQRQQELISVRQERKKKASIKAVMHEAEGHKAAGRQRFPRLPTGAARSFETWRRLTAKQNI